MAFYIHRTPYSGKEQLVISLDIGATNTGVAYAHLCAGDLPEVHMVTTWPGQPASSGDTKIPTLIAYQNGLPLAFGLEAQEHTGDDDFEIAKWFKLHLHTGELKLSEGQPSASGNVTNNAITEIPPLPSSVTLFDVYVDFLGFLYYSTRDYFAENTANGPQIWDRLRVSNDFVIIMAIPNGWGTTQQGILRSAAVQAGWVTKNNAESCLTFVSEGEASVHFALAHQTRVILKERQLLVVVDAGGSTVDSALYECKTVAPKLTLEEVCASECVQAGGIFVDRAALVVVQQKLRQSIYGGAAYLQVILNGFEKTAKRLYDGARAMYSVAFGLSHDSDRPNGIEKGRLILSNKEIAGAFNDSITRIVSSCRKLLRGRKVTYVILVGGFGESKHLQNRLKEEFQRDMAQLVVADQPLKKAAAEGAVIWHLKKLVVARAARLTYGVDVIVPFNPGHAGHQERRHNKFIDFNGIETLPDAFSVLVTKDTIIDENYYTSHHYWRIYGNKPNNLQKFAADIIAWSGEGCPIWSRSPEGELLPNMRNVGTIEADLSGLCPLLRRQIGVGGRVYWRIDFEICISFGGTELKAMLQWVEGDTVCMGPATVVPNSMSELFA